MDNEKIAELTTRIIESAVRNEKITYRVKDICLAYENIYTTIKNMDQDDQQDEE